MKNRYASKISAYSPNHEPITPYGKIRKRNHEGQIKSFDSQKELKDVFFVNNEILQDMKNLHDEQILRKSEGEKPHILLQLKNGYDKMQQKAKSIGLTEESEISGDKEGDSIRKQIIEDLINAKALIVTLE